MKYILNKALLQVRADGHVNLFLSIKQRKLFIGARKFALVSHQCALQANGIAFFFVITTLLDNSANHSNRLPPSAAFTQQNF